MCLIMQHVYSITLGIAKITVLVTIRKINHSPRHHRHMAWRKCLYWCSIMLHWLKPPRWSEIPAHLNFPPVVIRHCPPPSSQPNKSPVDRHLLVNLPVWVLFRRKCCLTFRHRWCRAERYHGSAEPSNQRYAALTI